jgi:hypothetical protein
MITKKDYVYYLSCEKKYWLKNDEKSLETKFYKMNMKWHNDLVDHVKKRFIDHVVIDDSDLDKAVMDTQSAIDKGIASIFNAVFKVDGLLLKVDFLNKKGGIWQVISIKNILSSSLYSFTKNDSSTKEVKLFLKEMAFQKYVIDKTEIIADASYCIMTLNYNYKRDGELDLLQLTKIFNLDKHLELDLIDVESNVDKMKKIKEEPKVMVGGHCKSPELCPYKDKCWKNIKEESIHNIPRITQKKRELFESNGWHTIFDIEKLEDNLTDIQRNVINKVKNGKVRKNKMKILFFLTRLKFPINHLDFETYFPNIPKYNGMRPMDAVPFQYSLHIEKKDGSLDEKSFLHTEDSDPRLEFIKQLIVNLDNEGSILVYNKTFESGIINNLIASFPEYTAELKRIDGRLVDLMIPFKEQEYWHPKMLFSYSLKFVLPALVPSMSYANLGIKDGLQAMLEYERLITLPEGDEKSKLIKDFLIYCGQDTLAMVKILEVIRKD